MAVAGTDLTAIIGNTPAVLDGGASYVIGLPGVTPDTATWTIVVAPPASGGDSVSTIEDSGELSTNVYFNVPGLYVVRLDVSHEGRTGRPAYLNIYAKEVFTPPVAVAGPDQIVEPGQEVSLDGSSSFSPDGGGLDFSWTQVSGTEVGLVGADSPVATFTAPNPAGELVFSLVVTDERRLVSEEALTRVTVLELPPVAVIDAPESVDEQTDPVFLRGDDSFDPNGQEIVGYAWQAHWPNGPITVLDANQSQARFAAPPVAGSVPPITVTLMVTNEVGDFSSSSVEIELDDVFNNPPIADAGAPQTVGELDVVSLDGSGSSDPNGDPLSFLWSQAADSGGPTISISNPDSPNPTFIAPRVTQTSDVTLALSVKDDREAQDLDTVVVTIEKTIVALGMHLEPPATARAGDPFSVAVEILDLDGNRDIRANDQISLSLSAGPAGGSLGGISTRAATDGLAVFDGLFIQRAGHGYRITAASPLLSSATTEPFQVSPGLMHSLIDLQASPSSLVADGSARSNITSGQIVDDFGNIASDGTLVTVSTNSGAIDATNLSALPGIQIGTSGGSIDFDLVAGTTAGPALVTAEVVEGDGEGSVTVVFVPGLPSGDIPLVAAESVMPADGLATTTITGGPVTDQYGNIVADDTLITVSSQGGTLDTTDVDPGSPGVQVATQSGGFSFEVIVGTTAGDMILFAESVEGDGSGQTTVLLEPTPAAGPIDLIAVPDVLVADGIGESVVTSDVIRDPFGNAVVDDTPVTLTVTGDAALVTPDSTPLDTENHTVDTLDGIISFVVRAGVSSGPVAISASVGAASGDVLITLIPGPAAALVLAGGDAQVGIVNHTLSSSLLVRVEDENGNPVADTEVQWAAIAGGGSVSSPISFSNEQGLAQVLATLGTVAGENVNEYSASALDAGGTALDGSPVVFVATALAGPLSNFQVEGLPNTVTAGSVHGLTVTALDEFGNVAPGYTGTVAFTSPDDRAVLPANSSFDVADQGVLILPASTSLRTAGLQTVTATDIMDGTLLGVHQGVLVEPAPASTLSVRDLTTPRTSGVPGNFTVEALDPFSNRATGYTGTISFTSSDNAAVLPSSYTFTLADSGIREFTGGAELRTAGTHELVAVDALDPTIEGSQESIVVLAADPSALVFDVQPTNAQAGASISPAMRVHIHDEFGNLVTTATSQVQLAIAENPGGGQVFGSSSTAAVGGVAEFGDIFVDKVGAGYTLTASSTGLTGDESNPFDISPGEPSSVVATAWPSADVTAGAAFTVEAEIHDSFGNLVPTYATNVSAAILSGPPGAQMIGTNVAAPSGGVAIFDDLRLDLAGDYVLALSSGTLNQDQTVGVRIVPAGPVALEILAQPTDPVGADLPFMVSAEVTDTYGNRVLDHAGTATISILSGPPGAILSGAFQESFASGVVTFAGLSLDLVGAYVLEVDSLDLSPAVTETIEIVERPATSLSFHLEPPLTLTAGQTFPVEIQGLTAQGDRATAFSDPVSVAIQAGPTGAAIGGTIPVSAVDGLAVFDDLVLEKAGDYVLVATSGTLEEALSIPFTVVPAAAAGLHHVSSPSGVIAGADFSVVFEVHDHLGNLVTDYSSEVSLSLTMAPPEGSLFGPSAINAAGGVATFEGLSLRVAGDYVIEAASGTLTTAATPTIALTAAAAHTVQVVDEPGPSVGAGDIFTVVSEIRDEFGNRVETYGGSVTVEIHSGPAGASLGGTTTVSAVAGLATFGDLSLTTAGPYVLEAAATDLVSGLTSSFLVEHGAPVQLAIVSGAHSVVAGACATPLTIEVQDQYGNASPVAADTTLRLESSSGTMVFSGSLDCSTAPITTVVIPAAGTSATLSFEDTIAGSPLITVEADGLTWDSQIQTISPAAPFEIVFESDPFNVTAGVCAGPAALRSIDELGNASAQASDTAIILSTDSAGMQFFTDSACDPASAVTQITMQGGQSLVSFHFRDTAAGTPLITADPEGFDPVSQQQEILAGPAAKLVLTAYPVADLDAGEVFTVAAQVSDEFGNIITGATGDAAIAFGANPAGGTLLGTTPVSVVGGIVSFDDLSIEAAGAGYTLVVSYDVLADVETPAFDVVPGPAHPSTTTIAANPVTITADGLATSTITFQAKDVYGNNLTTGGDTVALNATAGTLGAVTDNGDGTYTATITSSTTVETATITGTLGAVSITDTATVEFVAGAADPATTTITAAPMSITADGLATSTITVQAKDANGNDLITGGDTVSLSTTAGTLGAVTDNGDGTYTATITSSTTAGTATISGTINAVSITDTATVEFVAGAAAPTTTTITANPASITADGLATSTITVQAKDVYGNNLTTGGDTVALGTTAGTLGAVTDNGDGTYTATLASSTTVETATITGTLGADSITDTATVDFVAGAADPTTTTITADPSTLVADGISTSTITVQAKDVYGNNLTTGGDSVAVRADMGSISGLLDNGDGTYTATYTAAATTGTDRVYGAINTEPIASEAAIQLVAGPPAEIFLSAMPASPVAGEPTTLTAYLIDANGHPVSGEEVTFSVVTGQGTLEAPSTLTTDAFGMASIVYTSHTEIETAILMVELVSNTAIFDTVEVTSAAAHPTHLVVTLSPSSPQAVGSTFMVIAEARDADGNLATGYAGMVSIAIQTGPAGSTLAGQTQVQAMGGMIAFLDLSVDRVGTYVLRVTDDLGVLGFADTASFVVERFQGGTGTTDDPFQVANVYQLQEMIHHLDEHFVLTADIDASDTVNWNGGLGFIPIGDDGGLVDNDFTGTFDGGGHTITGLYVNRTGQRGCGLFGYVDSNAMIKDICLLDVDITCPREVGAIAGRIDSGDVVVRNVCSTGRVEATTEEVGGLIGRNGGWLHDCYSRAHVVVGNRRAGGIAGDNDGGTIDRCYSTGTVQGVTDVGGLIGRRPNVTRDSFWDIETSGWTTSPGGTGKTTEEMKDVRTFTDVAYSTGLNTAWDFIGNPFDDVGVEDIWNLDSDRLINDGYPVLEPIEKLGSEAFELVTFEMLAVSGPGTVDPLPGTHTHTKNVTLTLTATPSFGSKLDYWIGDVSGPDWLITTITLDSNKTAQAFFAPLFAGGNGSPETPYLIEDVQDLQAMLLNLQANYEIIGDIDASQTSLWNDGAGFLPVGDNGTRFTGSLDGQGHLVIGLHINRPGVQPVGLFGSLGGNAAGANLVQKVCLKHVYIVGGREVGAIVGRTAGPSRVEYVCSTGRVEATTEEVGGLIGRHDGATSHLENSYSRAAVYHGDRRAGGVVGDQTNNANINMCYSTGFVLEGNETGGLVGRGPAARTVDSYWDIETSNQTVSAGGTGLTTAQMKDPTSYTNWDFATVWNIDGVIAEGYPFLRIFWE